MGHYEFIDHTADIIIRATGDSLEDAFATAAKAMFAVITDSAPIDAIETFELEIDSIDLEGLLVQFLSELIVIHETEDVVLADFTITFGHDFTLKAIARGEKFDSLRHGRGTPVKGISYHMMEIEPGGKDRPGIVQVLFDI